jgi:hypothetical protein
MLAGKIQGILVTEASDRGCRLKIQQLCSTLRLNSLRIRAGNLFRPSRELNRAIREFIGLIRESRAGRRFTHDFV